MQHCGPHLHKDRSRHALDVPLSEDTQAECRQVVAAVAELGTKRRIRRQLTFVDVLHGKARLQELAPQEPSSLFAHALSDENVKLWRGLALARLATVDSELTWECFHPWI